uniref:Transmembrane protein n=1 Tax=Panagrellus redivivus TaxID=6233 RepID=A0A7E4VXK6_PANRE
MIKAMYIVHMPASVLSASNPSLSTNPTTTRSTSLKTLLTGGTELNFEVENRQTERSTEFAHVICPRSRESRSFFAGLTLVFAEIAMAVSTFRGVQLAVAATLIGFTVLHSLNNPDAWLYTWLTGSAAILLTINKPNCPYWRLASAFVIVLGAIETAFLAWTLREVESGALLAHSHSIPEGRNILLTALATSVTLSTRLRDSSHISAISYVRSLILVLILTGLVPVLGYSACFYTNKLPICHLFH